MFCAWFFSIYGSDLNVTNIYPKVAVQGQARGCFKHSVWTFFFSSSPDWEYIDVTTTASTVYYIDCLQELSTKCQGGLLVLITCIVFIIPIPSTSFRFLSGKKKNKHRDKKLHHHPKAEHHSSWVADLAQAENTESKSAFRQLIANEEKQSTSCEPDSNKKTKHKSV